MKKILILGASGLVGGRLALYLREMGFKVRAGTRKPHFQATHAQETVYYDWDRPVSLQKMVDGVDAVVHLAMPNANQVASKPQISAQVLAGNRCLLEALRGVGVARLIYLSSIHVYGSAIEGRVTEATSCNPTHPYALLHENMENLILQSGLSALILRSSNGVGWPVRPDIDCWMLLANDLCRQLASAGRFRLSGDRWVERDFLPLHEIVKAIHHFLYIKGDCQGIWLLASGQTRTVGWLANRITAVFSRLSSGTLPERLVSCPPDRPPRFSLDIGKLRASGFEPRADFEAELENLMSRCLEWFRPKETHPAGKICSAESRV